MSYLRLRLIHMTTSMVMVAGRENIQMSPKSQTRGMYVSVPAKPASIPAITLNMSQKMIATTNAMIPHANGLMMRKVGSRFI